MTDLAQVPLETTPAFPTALAERLEDPPESEPLPVARRIYFLRHAPAGDRASWEGPDDARPLTDKGRRRFRREAKGLRDLVGTPDAIVSSPYARAQETAELAAKALRFTGEIELDDHLVHGGDPHMVQRVLESRPDARDLVLVGHSPDLERWVGYLVTGRDDVLPIELKKGGLCRVDVRTTDPEPRGLIKWVVQPSMVRALE